MVDISHKNLTGAQLHEPKGVDNADFGSVYVADGEGSGSWDFIGFTTGDIKPTIKTSADSGWVMLNDGTIGNSSSGATTRANSDTEALYTLLWTNVSDTYAPVTGGRGASAASDFATNKPIKLLKVLGRVLGSAGAGSGLTSRALGEAYGDNTRTITKENIPNYNLTVTDPGHSHVALVEGGLALPSGGSAFRQINSGFTGTSVTNITVNSGGSGTELDVVQATLYINWMIKL